MTTIPLSLYLALKEGETADLEVAAMTAIAWSKLIKDTAYIIDPSSKVHVKLVGNADGSLSINSVLEFISRHAPDTTLRAIAVGALIGASSWLVEGTLSYAHQKLLDSTTVNEAIVEIAYFFGLDIQNDINSMSEEEVNRLAEQIAAIVNSSP